MTVQILNDVVRSYLAPLGNTWVLLCLVFALLIPWWVKKKQLGPWIPASWALLAVVLIFAIYPSVLEVCGVEDFGKGLWTEAEIHRSHGNRWFLPALVIKRVCEPYVAPWAVHGMLILALLTFPAILWLSFSYAVRARKSAGRKNG